MFAAKDEVAIGKTVTIRQSSEKVKRKPTLSLVPYADAAVVRYPNESLIGQALIGKKTGGILSAKQF